MAHTKAAGSTKLGRDSQSKRLGVKVGDGQAVHAGSVLVRQRGSKFEPGLNVRQGKDDTLFATSTGKVKYDKRKFKSFTGSRTLKTVVSIQA